VNGSSNHPSFILLSCGGRGAGGGVGGGRILWQY